MLLLFLGALKVNAVLFNLIGYKYNYIDSLALYRNFM